MTLVLNNLKNIISLLSLPFLLTNGHRVQKDIKVDEYRKNKETVLQMLRTAISITVVTSNLCVVTLFDS